MPHVFISYRRDDSAGHAARIAERLRATLGHERVFFDMASIEEGSQWEAAIAERMKVTQLFVVVIGARWFDEERRARLADPQDKLRQEIATALKAKARILPVLVDGARMPAADGLPEDIRGLAAIQALPLPEPYFDQGIDRILRGLVTPWRKYAAIAGAVVVVALAAVYGPGLLRSKSTYVVQVFEEMEGRGVPKVTVRVKSLPSEELAEQITDAEGLARFSLDQSSILAMGLEYTRNGLCTGAKLPAFPAPPLPAVTPVYLNTIPPRVRGECGEGSDVSGTAVGTSVPVASQQAGTVVGDRSQLRNHLPWGVPEAPLIVGRHPYVVGFDPKLKLARWVGYKVNSTGPGPRSKTVYVPDPLIPAGDQAPSSAYAKNPYDRGNFVRRADVSDEDEPEVFYLSVLAPQADRMNQGVWIRIEAVATTAADSSDVWVLTGPAFVPAPGAREAVFPMLAGNVPVPTHWFRVILRRSPQGPLEALAFLVPNTFVVTREPTDYLTSIAEIERVTGLRLLADLPDADRKRVIEGRASQLWTAN